MFQSNTFLFAFPALAVLASPALAQNNEAPAIEEIIVNADYRTSSLRDIPASITVLDAALMQRKNATHLEDILLDAPNVNFASGSSRARFYQIRGIGERGQFSEPLNSSVGIIIDGVDFSGIGNAALLYDMEQVEILLGPQGTRYGSNALAGLINLQSKAPAETNTFGLQLESANYGSKGIAGYASGPLSDSLGWRLSAQKIESDGFSNNLFLDKPTNGRDESIVRGKLRWQPSDTLSLDLIASRLDVDNGYDAFSLDNIRDTLSDEPGVDRQRSDTFSSKLTVDVFEPFTLEAILGYADSDIVYGYDEDWVYAGFHPFEYSSTDYYYRGRDTASAELRLISSEAGRLFSETTDWVFGLYSLQQEVGLTRVYTYLPADFASAYDIGRKAVFAETSTLLGENWSLDVGLRAERFDARYRDSDALAFDPDENLFGGKLALNYHTTTNDLLYASLSRGYKTGGFNTDGSLDADLREFDSEQLWNYEIGFKGDLLDGRMQTQVAVFYMDRDEVQISSSTLRLRENGSTEFIDFVGNAAAGSNYGLEFNGSWLVTDSFKLYGSLGLLKTEYQDFINSAGDNLDGREQAHAPSYQYSLGTDISLSTNLLLNINLQARDEFYFSDSHNEKSDAYELLNASLGYTLNSWHFNLWGRNLGDEDYYVRGYYFGNDPRDDYTSKGYTQLGEPRRYGLTVNYDF